MRAPSVNTFDFETKRIEARPHYPPEPVGVSIQLVGERKSKYYAWAHPTENNCTKKEAEAALLEVSRSPHACLGQNMKFDIDVLETFFPKVPKFSWDRIHDTLFLIFFDNPHATSHSLKPSAERILGMKPEEQDAVRDWLVANQGELRAQGLLPLNERITMKNFGAWISLAPGKLVGAYANGDVDRTLKLFKKLYPSIYERGMLPSYERERQLMLFLLNNERQGLRADLEKLETDCASYENAMEMVDKWIRKTLKNKDLNVDSDAELAQALIAANKAYEGLFERTSPSARHPEGQLSASKDSLIHAVTDKRVMDVLQYRGMLGTRLGTFLQPWRDEAQETGGLVHPSWNQVKQYGGSGAKGARTGRLSASRFMNAPTEVGTSQHDNVGLMQWKFPDFIKGLPMLPAVRMYLLPDKSTGRAAKDQQVWCKRDYAQQELRILAHFENGVLMNQYLKDPKLDVHTFATNLVESTYNIAVGRTRMKTISFSLLYGMGITELASRLGIDQSEAKSLKSMYLGIFPGLKDLQDQLKARAKNDEPIYTWGGREYYVEPPKEIKGRVRTFEYKLLNYLIQGSAADCTKQALCNYSEVMKDGRFLITVHDEINFSAPAGKVNAEMKVLREAMADVEFDVQMLSDGKTGPRWGELKKFVEAD